MGLEVVVKDVLTRGEKLATLPESEREEIIKKLLESQTDSTRVFSNENDESLVKRISSLEYGGIIPCSGGVILENEDGTVLRDLTFDSILKNVRDRSLTVSYTHLTLPTNREV